MGNDFWCKVVLFYVVVINWFIKKRDKAMKNSGTKAIICQLKFGFWAEAFLFSSVRVFLLLFFFLLLRSSPSLLGTISGDHIIISSSLCSIITSQLRLFLLLPLLGVKQQNVAAEEMDRGASRWFYFFWRFSRHFPATTWS